MNELLDRISIDPQICGGKPCIRGTRIWVSLILDFLAADMTEADLLRDYPQLTHEDVLAATAYGADASRADVSVEFRKLVDNPLPPTDALRRLLKTKAPWE
jgi:uncharacterized protein (DUF433 family)